MPATEGARRWADSVDARLARHGWVGWACCLVYLLTLGCDRRLPSNPPDPPDPHDPATSVPAVPVAKQAVPVAEWPRLDLRVGDALPPKPLARTVTLERDRFALRLEAGDYFEATFDQTQGDLVVFAFDPAGQQLFELDSPLDKTQPERFAIHATRDGWFGVEVRSWEAKGSVPYSLTVRALRPGSASDELRYRAIRADAMGGALRRMGGCQPSTQPGGASFHYQAAAQAWRQVGERAAEAESLLQLGRCFGVGNRVQEAEAPLRSAIELIDATPGFRPMGKALVLTELGLVMEELGIRDEAIGFLRQGRLLYSQLGVPRGEAGALGDLGRLAFDQGDLAAAERLMTRALGLWKRLGDRSKVARTLGDLGALYLRMGEHRIAWMHYREAADVVPKGAQFDHRRAYNRLRQGDALLELGDVHGARRIFTEIGPLLDGLDGPNLEARAQSGLGRAAYTLGEFDVAEAAFAIALAQSIEVGDLRDESSHRQNLAWAALRLGERDRAETLFETALEQTRQSDHRASEAACHLGLAELAHARGDLPRAMASVERALELLEAERSSTTRLDLRTSHFADTQDYFGVAIGIAVDLYHATGDKAYLARAFAVGEQARGRLLLDALASESRPDRNDPSLHLRGLLNRAVADHRRLIAEGGVDRGAVELAEQAVVSHLTAYRARYERVSNEPEVNPRVAKTLDLPAARALLDPGTVLIQIALGRDRSFRWTVSTRGAEVAELAPAAVLEEAALAAHQALRGSAAAGSGRSATRATQRFAELVLDGVDLPEGVEQLLVAVDGLLAYVPFAALPLPSDGGAMDRLLIDDFEVIQVPSLSVVMAMRARSPAPPPSTIAVVFGDPVFDQQDSRLPPVARSREERSAMGSGPRAFTRLRHAAREMQSLRRLVPGDASHVLSGFDATKAALLEGPLPLARILHFATHGISDARFPELSGLATARFDARGSVIEDFVFAHELQGLGLQSDLAVLSACETGLGAEIAGEGLVGLSHAFFRAGVPRVVVSLWNVNDRAATDLMALFYSRLLQQGVGPAEALRDAQRALRDDPRYRRPFYWAAFVLRGEWMPPATPFLSDGV